MDLRNDMHRLEYPTGISFDIELQLRQSRKTREVMMKHEDTSVIRFLSFHGFGMD
jgi:hypothetical protein